MNILIQCANSFLLQSPLFLLIAILLSFFIKIYLLKTLIKYGLQSSTIHTSWFFILYVLLGSILGDAAWIVRLSFELNILDTTQEIVLFITRISWGFLIFQYQALGLFIESLTQKKFILKLRHKLCICATTILSGFFFFIAFFDVHFIEKISLAVPIDRIQPSLEMYSMQWVIFYALHLLIAPSLITTFWYLYIMPLPKILKKQLKVVLIYFICPYIIAEGLQASHYTFPLFHFHLYSIVALSTILIICAVTYCIHKIIGLRFLNVESRIQSNYNINFLTTLKQLLEKLCHATNSDELKQLTQTFFSTTFGISQRKTTLVIRNQQIIDKEYALQPIAYGLESIVENFVLTHTQIIENANLKRPIFIFDELEFSNFYEYDPERKTILSFLESINADIFLPLYEKNNLIAYIIVEQSARTQEFYGNTEQDEMLIFGKYLGSIINLFNHRNLKNLIHKEKELKEELYYKYQELNQYKESIQSFLRDSHQKEIGIVYYKNNRFIFGNTIAKKLIAINLATQETHPLAKIIKNIVNHVITYKSNSIHFYTHSEEKKLVLYGMPNLDQNSVMIIIYQPEISDLLIRNLILLKDPTKWDYLLYLETTQSGQLINRLIPESGESFLNFKINLLKAALGKKALLLEMPDEDLLPMVEIIHHISLRKTLHILNLEKLSTTTEVAIKLFGINSLLDHKKSHKSLLSILDTTGSLFIKNIEFLDLETQKYLAEFLKYGMYRIFKSDEKIVSNARIICSTQQDLSVLVQQKTFCQELFNELSKTSLIMPSLTTLSEKELQKLAEGFTKQAIKINDFNTKFELTDIEKNKINSNRPLSLQDLKSKIKKILLEKSQKNIQYEEAGAHSTNEIDEELSTIARLGKKALRDKQMMVMLWNKFHNQNTIADFLKVHRSSINRRCKEYGLR